LDAFVQRLASWQTLGRVLSGSYRQPMDSSARRSARDLAPTAWNVLWHQPAVVELQQIKELKARKAVLSVADILRQLGPRLVEPHCKKVQGDEKLFELRPGGGRVPVRPLYARWDERTFIVLAVGPEAIVDPAGFNAVRARARDRARADFGWQV
jgi:hypothetical protein